MVAQKIEKVLSTAKQYIFGQDELLEAIMAALVCEGHVLIEGMPGLGKTYAVSIMSRICDLSFQRIQFTPDLLPSDLIGTMIYNQAKEEFTTKFGPIFTQLLLSDEINRSPAKVQAALLEAMAEKQVTIGNDTHPLAPPFVVLATQNPIDQEGTYQLPEAQMDRFMMKVNIGYPDAEAEKQILNATHPKSDELDSLVTSDDLIQAQEEMDKIHVDPKITDFIVNVVNATRPHHELFDKNHQSLIQAGVSPRASLWLHKLGKYNAFLAGSDFVAPDHILKVVPQVLAHRMILTYEATLDRIDPRELAYSIAQRVL